MIKHAFGMAALVLACAAATALPVSTARAADATVKCDMTYNLAGWSLLAASRAS